MFDDCEAVTGSLGVTDRRLNVVQILVVCVLTGFGAGGLALGLGFGWVTAVLAAWAGSILGTLGLTAILFLVDEMFAEPVTGRTELPTGDAIDAMIAAWDEDLVSERVMFRDSADHGPSLRVIEGGALPAARRKG